MDKAQFQVPITDARTLAEGSVRPEPAWVRLNLEGGG